jgi:hypothetical protein
MWLCCLGGYLGIAADRCPDFVDCVQFRMIAFEQRIQHSNTNGIGASSFGFIEVNSLGILSFAGSVFGITFIAFWRRSSRKRPTTE